MRILVIHRYFWPDTPPYASMLRAIAETLIANGHEVSVFTTQPSYKPGFSIPKQKNDEVLNGVRIRRMNLIPETKKNALLRVVNLTLFMAGIFVHAVFRDRCDVIMASSAPAVMVGAVARWAAKLSGAGFVYHCQDIHPELGRLSGHFHNPLLYRWLLAIDSANCRDAAAVVVLSADMSRAIQERKGCAGKHTIHVINNFSLPVFSKAVVPEGQSQQMDDLPLPRTNNMRIMFAGNIGRFQGLDVILDAFGTARHRFAMELIFMGEGAEHDSLKNKVIANGANNVLFIPHQPVDIAKRLIAKSDICLISLIPGIYKYAYPSKTMTYLELGKPILAIVESDSELARFISVNNLGYVALSNDISAIADTIDTAWERRSDLPTMAENAKRIWITSCSPENVLPRWVELFDGIARTRRNV